MSFRISTASLARHSLIDMGNRQQAIMEAREHIATGQRINRPSDDPGQAARLRELDTARGRLTQYERNASMAEAQLSLEESALGSVGDALARIRELTVQAANDTNGPLERQAISVEIEGRLAGLYELANVRDATGDALFGGTRNGPDPFTMPLAGGSAALYAGDDITRRVSLGAERSVAIAHTGRQVFLDVPAGNGRFTLEPAATNAGTGTIDAGDVIDGAAWTDVDHVIEFTSATSFDVRDAGGGIVLAGASYEPGAAIEFAGVRTAIDGAPAAGDTFELGAGVERDLFARVANLVDTLRAAPGDAAAAARQEQGMQIALTELDGAMEHISAMRADAGVRLQTVDASRDESSALALQIDTTIGSLRDADIVEEVVRLESETRSLEVLQKSHARLAGISILDYL